WRQVRRGSALQMCALRRLALCRLRLQLLGLRGTLLDMGSGLDIHLLTRRRESSRKSTRPHRFPLAGGHPRRKIQILPEYPVLKRDGADRSVATRPFVHSGHGLNSSASIRPSGESFATISNTIAVGLVTGAGLEPVPPACAGALTVKLPCVSSSPCLGNGNLDMSLAVGHLRASLTVSGHGGPISPDGSTA